MKLKYNDKITRKKYLDELINIVFKNWIELAYSIGKIKNCPWKLSLKIDEPMKNKSNYVNQSRFTHLNL